MFVEELNRLGWVEGKNIAFEHREHLTAPTGLFVQSAFGGRGTKEGQTQHDHVRGQTWSV